jgi:lysophospholipase L1-like esterase
MGFYFQVETCWANQSTTLGDGKPVDQWVYDETARLLKAYGNHPSFLLMPYGNEPGGKRVSAFLKKYVEHFKAEDPRRLWTSGSGWPQLAVNQFDITPDPRIQGWGEELKSRVNAQPPETTTDYRDYINKRSVPVISHEIGQWCVFPNFDEIPKYTGYLKPKNFGIFRDTLDSHGMGDLAHQFLIASGKLQTLCYKEDIESALRTPGMGGFELLDLHDFPGQGTALVGVLDPFWEDKGYVTAREYRRFCNTTVPLARLSKRVFTTDETLTAPIEVANFAEKPIVGTVTKWKLVDDNNKVAAHGELPVANIPIGNGISLGEISASLKNIPAPSHLRLAVEVAGFENDWGLWVYPAAQSGGENSNIFVTSKFDEAAKTQLESGRTILLTIPGDHVRNYETDPVKLGFSSIFWNTAWTGRQAPTTLGILCDPKSPALAEFPTKSHSDWQWWYLIHRAGVLRLDLLPPKTKPVVRVIDDWVTSRPLGLIVEGKCGRGKIVVCGFDLTKNSDDPVSRQMLKNLEDYAASAKFSPTTEFSTEQIESLAIKDRSPEQETYLADISNLLNRQWPTNRAVNIVFHGHSVPAGYFKTPKVDSFNAYPHLVHVALKDRFPYAVINCIVTAIGGENSEQGAKRFEHDVLALHPDVVTIDYALNDRGLGVARAETAWRQMIEAALKNQVKVLLLTPSIDLRAHLDDPKDPLNQQAEMIRRLAAEYHVGLADSLAAFKDYIRAHHSDEELMAQSNHPNRRGHELIAHEIEKWFP